MNTFVSSSRHACFIMIGTCLLLFLTACGKEEVWPVPSNANTNTGTDTLAPTVPNGLAATAVSATLINLAWSASIDSRGVTGYRIYRDTVEIASSASTAYQSTGLTETTTYCFRVTAYDAAGNLSAQSVEACATTLAAPPPDITAPTVPTGMAASVASDSQINLSWNAATDAVGVVGYTVFRDGVEISSTTATTYQDTGLAGDTPYTYTVLARDAAGNDSAQSAGISATTERGPTTATFWQPPLNDTGINAWGGTIEVAGTLFIVNNLAAAQSSFPGQDADFGRDAKTLANTLAKVGGGLAGFDYTKLDASGAALPDSALAWSCVRDNHTGLIWEIKRNDGGLRDQDNTYTWYNADPASNGGAEGAPNGGSCTGSIDCDTSAFVGAVNAAGLCGANDWRLPNIMELQSIVYSGASAPGPTIDTDYFPDTPIAAPNSLFWSSTPYAGDANYAWSILFANGNSYSSFINKFGTYSIRLVRGGE